MRQAQVVKVKIGRIEKGLEDADENWINEEVNRLREASEAVCVRVRIQTHSLDLTLATLGCGARGGRRPKPSEQEIFELWKKRGLTKGDFSGGDLVAFLKQVRKLLRY